MIRFIQDHRSDHGVEPICRVLPIVPATFYDHLAKRADPLRRSDRAKRDAELKPEIERVFEENLSVYGVRKIWHQMRREGFDIARCTVARLMKDIGIEGVVRGKKPKTTIPDKALPCPLDKVNRQFHASGPNELWVSDFTYVATWQGLFMWLSSLMFLRGASLAGAQAAQPMQASFSMLWNRPFINAGQPKTNWCITQIADRNICRSNIPNG
jgi:putative transposase